MNEFEPINIDDKYTHKPVGNKRQATIPSEQKPWFVPIYATLTDFGLDAFGMKWPEVDRRYF